MAAAELVVMAHGDPPMEMEEGRRRAQRSIKFREDDTAVEIVVLSALRMAAKAADAAVLCACWML